MEWDLMDVSKVKGVGPKSLQLLNKIGIYTLDDLDRKSTRLNSSHMA